MGNIGISYPITKPESAPNDPVYLVQFDGTNYNIIGDSNTNDLVKVKK